MAIIGIVVILLMPRFIDNINDRKYTAGRQKALATIGEAGRYIAVNGKMNDAVDTEDFVENYLKDVLSIAKTCGTDNFENCGMSKVFKNLKGVEMNLNTYKTAVYTGGPNVPMTAMWDIKGYSFLLQNGFSIYLYYNPECEAFTKDLKKLFTFDKSQRYVCMNAIYDMNGLAGPNQMGKDMGIVSVLFPDETVKAVAPILNPAIQTTDLFSYNDAVKKCSDQGLRLPNLYETIALARNSKIFYSLYGTGEVVWTAERLEINAYGEQIHNQGVNFTGTAKALCIEN